MSPATMDSSFSLWPAKSYKTFAIILGFTGGAAGGGGGGARAAPPPVLPWFFVWLGSTEVLVEWFAAGVGRETGVGTGAGVRAVEAALMAAGGCGTDLAAPAPGLGFAVRLPVNLDGRPLGPPGLMSLPRVIGLGGTGLPLGVGLDPDEGDSPCCVWTPPLL